MTKPKPIIGDPSITAAITAILEKAINTALLYDPASAIKLGQMGDCIIEVASKAPDINLYFQLLDDRVRVLGYSEAQADVIVSGKAGDFFAMMGSTKHSLADSNIEVSGKIALLNQLQDILSDLDIDWEEALSDILGVIPAHTVAEGLRASWQFFTRQKNTFKENLPQYLTEELRAIPSNTELESFYHGVDELRSASNRLEARVQRLLQNITENQNKS